MVRAGSVGRRSYPWTSMLDESRSARDRVDPVAYPGRVGSLRCRAVHCRSWRQGVMTLTGLFFHSFVLVVRVRLYSLLLSVL